MTGIKKFILGLIVVLVVIEMALIIKMFAHPQDRGLAVREVKEIDMNRTTFKQTKQPVAVERRGVVLPSPSVGGFVSIDQADTIYEAEGIMDIHQGSIVCWLRLKPEHPRGDHVIVHTDDSRIVFYVDTYFSQGMGREIFRVAARAGGNQRAVDSAYKLGNFPEASIIVNNDGGLSSYRSEKNWYAPVPFPEGQWHLVAMTWQGYPSGEVSIFLDGKLIGRKPYDSRYDNGGQLFKVFSVGFRPNRWTMESIEGIERFSDAGSMRFDRGGLEIYDLKIYQKVISQSILEEIIHSSEPSLF